MSSESGQGLPIIKWLDKVRQDDLPLVGGKGANLGELFGHGFPVPLGFCITTEAFQRFAEKIGLYERISSALSSVDISDSKQLRDASRTLREYIHSRQIPDDVRKAILDAYYGLPLENGGPTWVAVRSSATAEDLSEASFAGQMESYLNIRGDQNVLDAVRRCWEALLTERVIVYRENYGFSNVNVSMGVVVQKMVDATQG